MELHQRTDYMDKAETCKKKRKKKLRNLVVPKSIVRGFIGIWREH